jgi:hypothetical protein
MATKGSVEYFEKEIGKQFEKFAKQFFGKYGIHMIGYTLDKNKNPAISVCGEKKRPKEVPDTFDNVPVIYICCDKPMAG